MRIQMPKCAIFRWVKFDILDIKSGVSTTLKWLFSLPKVALWFS